MLPQLTVDRAINWTLGGARSSFRSMVLQDISTAHQGVQCMFVSNDDSVVVDKKRAQTRLAERRVKHRHMCDRVVDRVQIFPSITVTMQSISQVSSVHRRPSMT